MSRAWLASSERCVVPTESEIFDPTTDKWTLIDGSSRFLPETYPSARLLPNGQRLNLPMSAQLAEMIRIMGDDATTQ